MLAGQTEQNSSAIALYVATSLQKVSQLYDTTVSILQVFDYFKCFMSNFEFKDLGDINSRIESISDVNLNWV